MKTMLSLETKTFFEMSKMNSLLLFVLLCFFVHVGSAATCTQELQGSPNCYDCTNMDLCIVFVFFLCCLNVVSHFPFFRSNNKTNWNNWVCSKLLKRRTIVKNTTSEMPGSGSQSVTWMQNTAIKNKKIFFFNFLQINQATLT